VIKSFGGFKVIKFRNWRGIVNRIGIGIVFLGAVFGLYGETTDTEQHEEQKTIGFLLFEPRHC
jgi:hypothetical protein